MSFLLALQFLTIIPVRIKHFQERKMAQAAVFFPLVGCVLGVFLAVLYQASARLGFSAPAASTLCVVALIVLTGGMHLDGLADTADALGSAKDRSSMLAIMRDPAVGALGAAALTCAIVSKIVFLSNLPQHLAPAALILMTTSSRWTMVLAMAAFPYARQEGKASVFAKTITKQRLTAATMFALLPPLILWRTQGMLIFILAGFFAYFSSQAIHRKIQGYTGDTLGGVSESTEIFILLCVLTLQKTLP